MALLVVPFRFVSSTNLSTTLSKSASTEIVTFSFLAVPGLIVLSIGEIVGRGASCDGRTMSMAYGMTIAKYIGHYEFYSLSGMGLPSGKLGSLLESLLKHPSAVISLE